MRAGRVPELLAGWSWSAPLAFSIYGKAVQERDWRLIAVRASPLRNHDSGWPWLRGMCTCWSAELIAVGLDFAQELLADPEVQRVTRDHPVVVAGGSMTNLEQRRRAGAPPGASRAELLAHEIGHTWQARRYRFLYWPLVGAVTRCGEGPNWWNRFENQASAIGQFGGLAGARV